MIKYFLPKIRSRHPSHNVLRKKGLLPLFGFKSVIRLGSFTKLENIFKTTEDIIEINTVDAIKNSADKLLMKQCFTKNNVKTPDWFIYNKEEEIFNISTTNNGIPMNDLPYPIIAKHRLGSKGTGNYKLDSLEELETWLNKRLERLDEYIFEKFYNYIREYRLHITEDNYFYTCRKMLKSDTPDKDKWYRNDEHCVWITEENELFDKPICWDLIVEHSIKALKSTGLDFGAVDVKVQSSTNKREEKRENVDFIIIEINSAPSFGKITEVKYLEMLPQLILNKKNKQKKYYK
jgi:glutathione synthase/RimK-type ligase-like ATP-grasp enzyme